MSHLGNAYLTNSSSYFEASEAFTSEFVDKDATLDDAMARSKGDYPDPSDFWFRDGVAAIVFAGMCLEAASYEYAASHLPKSLVDSLDKLDLVSKIHVLPRLVVGRALEEQMGPVGDLVAYRNKLIHSKARPLRDAADHHHQLRTQMRRHVENSYRALLVVSRGFQSLYECPTEARPWTYGLRSIEGLFYTSWEPPKNIAHIHRSIFRP